MNEEQKELALKVFKELGKLAEPSLEEYKTTEYIVEFLKECGYEPDFVGETGCYGTLDFGAEKTVALRADIDALPANEERTVYKHLCGHNLNMTALLMTLKILSLTKNKLNVNIRYIFQPAEELVSGAVIMIKEGCMKNVDEIYAIHAEPGLAAGKIGTISGPCMAGSNHFRIGMKGKGTHAAYPHKGNDVITAACTYISEAQKIVSRLIDPVQAGLISFGSIKGGYAANIIPDDVEIQGTFRFFDDGVKETICNQMNMLLKNTAEFYGCKGELEVYEGTPPVINDFELAPLILDRLKAHGIDAVRYERMSMGGEDFAFYLQHVPGLFLWAGVDETGNHPPLHNDNFYVPDVAVVKACEAMLGLIMI